MITQITINIENNKILPHLKKILNAIEGVSIASTKSKKKSGLEEAMEDVENGNIIGPFHTVDELMADLLS